MSDYLEQWDMWDEGALYLRISHDPTGQGLGVIRQEQDGRKLADVRRVRIRDVYTDNDISASGKKKRPDFERLLQDVEAGLIKVVIAWDMTRLTRNAPDFLAITKIGQKVGLRIMFVNGNDVDMADPVSRSVAEIMSVFARLEMEQKSLRQKRAYLQRAQAGLPHGPYRVFGYEQDGLTVRGLVCPDCDGASGFTAERVCVDCGADGFLKPGSEADAVARACADVIAGVGSMQIAREWNVAGLGTSTGKQHGPQSVYRTLTNPRIAGIRTYLGKEIAAAAWPPIVSETVWRAVCAVFNDPSRKKGVNTAKLLLSGIATCSVCGKKIQSGGKTALRLNGRPRYRCANGHNARAAADLDAYVTGHIIARLSRDDARQLLFTGTEAPDIRHLQVSRTELQARQAELTELFARGKVSATQLSAGSESIIAQIAKVDDQIAAVGRAQVLNPLIEANDVLEAWKDLDLRRQREVVRTLTAVVVHPAGQGARVLDPSKVVITWRR